MPKFKIELPDLKDFEYVIEDDGQPLYRIPMVDEWVLYRGIEEYK